MHLKKSVILVTLLIFFCFCNSAPAQQATSVPAVPVNSNGSNTPDTTANSQNRLSHVTNASTLASWTNYGFAVTRDDVPNYVYIDTGASCAISGGDGGWQIQPAIGHCWQTDITRGTPITMWNAIGDDATDTQPAVAKAIAAFCSIGGGEIIIPATAKGFLFRSTANVNCANISIVGSKGGSLIDRGFASGHLFMMGSNTATYANLGVYDITIKNSTTATSAYAAEFEFATAPNSHAERINCLVGAYVCLGFDGSGPYFVRDLFHAADGQTAIAMGCATGIEPADIHIDGADVAYQHRSAFEMCYVGGVTFAHVNTDFNLHSIWAHPNAGQQVSAVYVTDSFFDVTTDIGILADGNNGGANGVISEWVLSDTTWVASAGTKIPSPFSNNVIGNIPVNTSADGIYIAAPSANAANVTDNRWFAHVFQNARNGYAYFGGQNNQFGSIVTQNCTQVPSSDVSCAGLSVASGATHWSFDGNSGPITNAGSANSQRYAVYISTGSSDYYYLRGDFSGNIKGPVFDGGNGLHKNVVGVIPGVPWTLNNIPLAATSGTLTTASGTLSYQTNGTILTFTAKLVDTTNGSGAGSLAFGLPIVPATDTIISARNQVTGTALIGIINAGQTNGYVQTPTGGYPGADNTTIQVSGSYQMISP